MYQSRFLPRPFVGAAAPGAAFAAVSDPPSDEAPFEPLTCIANIGPQQRRRRQVFGLRMFGAGGVLAVVLVLLRADVAWRLLLFLPFVMGASGYFQATDHT